MAALGAALPRVSTIEHATVVLDFNAAPEWMRIDLAARLAGVSKRSIRRWASAGLVRASRPAGGRVLVSRDSLRALIERGALSEVSAA